MSRTRISKLQNTKENTDGLIFYCNYDQVVDAILSNGSPTATLITNISGIWHFKDGAGDPADDSGNGHTLINNGATWIIGGKHGSALDFEADDSDYLAVASADFSPATEDFSYGIWVKPETAEPAAMKLIIDNSLTAFNDAWRLEQDTDGTVVASMIQRFVATADAVSTQTLTNGAWTFLVVTWDISEQKFLLYWNGVLETTGGVAGTITSIVPPSFFTVGSVSLGAAGHFDGILDEPFVLKGTVLTADEILFLYNNRWLGRTYFDGKFGQGYYAFGGSSLSYPAAGNINKDQGTIMMWVKPSWNGDDGIEHRFFDSETSSNRNSWLLLKTSADQLGFVVRDGDAILKRGGLFPLDSDNFAKNTLHHIAGTWDKDGNLKLYLDGVRVGTESGSGEGKVLELPTTMYIGRDATAQSNEANAVIDEPKIYDRALSAQEIEHSFKVQQPLVKLN